MTLTCHSLKWNLAFQAEIETGLCWRQHQILAARPVVSDKGPGPSEKNFHKGGK